MTDNQVGFDCGFIKKPPTSVQSECPVCLLVLREPFQATCCGYEFCRECIEKFRGDNKPCPKCNTKNFKTLENRTLKISLYAFRIHCTYKQQGCQWLGELGQLDNHLNYNPTKDKQLEGCQFSQIKCRYCFTLYQRSDILIHQDDQCPRRPYSCHYCKNYDSNYKNITNQHWFVCGYVPRPCPNKCGKTLQRQNLHSHITNDCPLTIIDCDFQHVGCEVRLLRKDMLAHLQESMVRHMSLHVASTGQVLATMERLDEENTQNKEQLKKLIGDLELQNIGSPLSPVEITVTNFEQKMTDCTHWQSPPFYTHEKGYKMSLHVDVYRKDRDMGTYVSVYISLMKGKFDKQLKWPFRGNVEIQLLNQDKDEGHFKMMVDFRDGIEAGNRVTEGEKATTKLGIRDFICHSDLRPKYLKNDCIKFRIKCIVI